MTRQPSAALDVDALLEELLTDRLEVDWVMFGAMPAHAHDVTTIRDPGARRAGARRPWPSSWTTRGRRFVDDDHEPRVITTRDELDTHLERGGRALTALPDDEVAGWLVERDYDVTHRRSD